jgi:ADP-ribose pyrophosphatase
MQELYSGYGWTITLEEGKLPDGRVKNAARAKRADSVHLLAFPEERKVMLLREFRPFYGQYLWMLPSGRVDKESDIRSAAQRELQEETGYRAAELQHYCTVYQSESLILANHIFLARELSPSPLPQDPDELIEVHVFPLEEALEKVLSSPIVHTPSAFALLRYEREFGRRTK